MRQQPRMCGKTVVEDYKLIMYGVDSYRLPQWLDAEIKKMFYEATE